MSDNIQSGRFYSLQEVSAQCGLAPYILRYWELHFPELTADNSKPKHMYNVSDISLINRIKQLLYVEHLTIEQAKSRLKQEMSFPVDDSAKSQESEDEQPAKSEDVRNVEQPEAGSDSGQTEQTEVSQQPAAEETVTPAADTEPDKSASETPLDEIHRVAAEELASLRSEVQSLQSQVEEERGKTENAKELLAAEVAKVLDLTQSLQTEQERAQAFEAELAQNRQELADAQAQIDELSTKLASAMHATELGETAHAAELEKLNAENAMLRGKVAAFVEQLKDLSMLLTKAN